MYVFPRCLWAALPLGLITCADRLILTRPLRINAPRLALLFGLLCCLPAGLTAQQTVRGTVLDAESRQPVPFATVTLLGSEPLVGTTTDIDGVFRLENVPLGRHTLVFTFVGYDALTRPNVEVTAGKEVVLEVAMQESFATLDEVVVKANADPAQAVNELASVSNRALSVEEASRYAASFADPARQAQNFAGVAGGGDDLTNDIVIRGNNPAGLLWRLEGVEIPNPNHFATLGSTGGAISMLSGNVLSTSDFFTAAFPAEYGDATAGVFDLRFRKGNNERRETTVGLGFLGVELAAEGPFASGGKSSYLVNYRYSTLSVMDAIGISVAGDFLPAYQDVSFNLNFPTAKLGTFNVFGLGGNSWAETEEIAEDEPGVTYLSDEKSLTTVGGLKHVIFIGDKGYVRSALVLSRQSTDNLYDITRDGTRRTEFDERFANTTLRFTTFYNHKFDARKTLRTGLTISHLDEELRVSDLIDVGAPERVNAGGSTAQYQAYSHLKWRLTERLTANGGVHLLYHGLTENLAIEPRLAFRLRATDRSSFSLGGGLHSRTEALSTYFIEDERPGGAPIPRNRNLDLARAAHVVAGWDFQLNPNVRFKAEAYFQHLYDLPTSASPDNDFISVNATSLFSYLNQRDTSLVNGGRGRNYGLEFTLERFLNKGYYYLGTLSLYASEFSLDDGETFVSTRYNGNYILNVLGGKEWSVGREGRNTLGLNGKFTVLGGQRYTPLDVAASRAAGETVFAATPFSAQLAAYYRADLGLSYKWNRARTSHSLSLNVQNVTGRLNEFRPFVSFDAAAGAVRIETQRQTGTLPILKYQFSF